jgi:hypothetical protein
MAAYERGQQARAAVNRASRFLQNIVTTRTCAKLAWGAGFDGSDLPKWKE